MTFNMFTFRRSIAVVLAALLSILCVLPAHAEDASPEGESARILQAFNKQHQNTERDKAVSAKEKQQIMFLLGVALITLVMITGGLGIAMGIYNKAVFVPHMVFAGLSMTLAVVHAIVGIVWFFPF
jgi:predicted phage tail protein